MNMNGVAIQYGDVAPNAKENFLPTASESAFDTLAQLQQYNLDFQNYANPCELYSVILDGTATAFPSEGERANFGLWSVQVSQDDGIFETPVVLTLTGDGQYSSQGFTFTFDKFNNIYCTHLNIKWYRDGQLIENEGVVQDKDFFPDNAFYFCRNQVENFDEIVITFYAINMPKNRLKLRVIDYGHGTFFYGNELRSTKLIQELDPISSQISINTVDFTLDSKTDMEYSFQAKQPLSVYFNGQLKATTFVKTSKRKAKFLWDVQSEDYIGVMDGAYFTGGMYDNAYAVEILTEIFDAAKVPFYIDHTFSEATVTGYIPYTTCRNALMHVAFAIMAVVDTSNSDVVNVLPLSNEVSQTVPKERIMQGQNFVDDETVTGVSLTSHSYTKIEASVDEDGYPVMNDYTVLYYAKDSGIGENIMVVFSEPMHDIRINSDTYGELIAYGTNYAVFTARSQWFRLGGLPYKHNVTKKTKYNDIVLKQNEEKIISIENATLISSSNVDDVLNHCFEWLIKSQTTNVKIVEAKHVSGGGPIMYGQMTYGSFVYGGYADEDVRYDDPVQVGDVIRCATEYLGEVEGRVIKETFDLNGGIIIKEAVLK